MIKRILKKRQLYVFTLIVIYCVSFSPFFLFHKHEHIEHSNHSLNCESSHEVDCESSHEELDIHDNCSHEKHFANLEERCVLCDYFALPEVEVLFKFIETVNRLNLDAYSQFCESVFLQEYTVYPNKSPPVFAISKI